MSLKLKRRRKIKEHYDKIILLRCSLLKINKLQQIEDYGNAHEIAQFILKSPSIRGTDATGEDLYLLQSDLQMIVHHSVSRLKNHERKSRLIFSAMVALEVGIGELYLYYRTSLASDSFPSSRTGLSTIVAGALGYVLYKPIAYAGFFAKRMIKNNSDLSQDTSTSDNNLPKALPLSAKLEPTVKYP